MSKVFRKFRGIPDKVIAGALQQHSGALAYTLNRINAYDRVKYLRWAWYLAVTAEIATRGAVSLLVYRLLAEVGVL